MGSTNGVGICMLAQGQCGQLQADSPTLRTRLERSDCVRRKVKSPGVSQQCRRFVGIEAEVGGAQLGELASAAHARGSGGSLRPLMTRRSRGGR
jgi:hypothetical protein